MVYQIAASRTNSATSENRSFQFEVAGWHPNQSTDRNYYAIRSSANVLLTVPFSRFNAELQRINRLGGKIVSIQPLSLPSP